MTCNAFIVNPCLGAQRRNGWTKGTCQTHDGAASRGRWSTSSNVQASRVRMSANAELTDEREQDMGLDDSLIVDIADADEDGVEDGEIVMDEDGTVVEVRAPERRKKVRQRHTRLIDQITAEMPLNTFVAADADTQPTIELDETTAFVRTVVRAADMRKGKDIVALRVSKLTYITSFVVMITGNNTPQLRAIANLVEEDLTDVHKMEPNRIDGAPNSGWILLDCMFFFFFLFLLLSLFSRQMS